MKTLYRKARVHLVLVATALLVVACGSNESGSSDEVPSFMEKQQEKKTYGIIKSVDEKDARAVLEYLRDYASKSK